jgi:hypothetical protein
VVEKFHDANYDGILDAGESMITGWEVMNTWAGSMR